MALIIEGGQATQLIKAGLTNVTQFIRENPIVSGAALGGSVLASVGAIQLVRGLKSRRVGRVTRRRKKGRSQLVKHKHRKGFGRHRHTPRTAGRGKDTSTRRIRYTKKGQPYIIMKSGKARFIKKSGAKRSHKQKGGRY